MYKVTVEIRLFFGYSHYGSEEETKRVRISITEEEATELKDELKAHGSPVEDSELKGNYPGLKESIEDKAYDLSRKYWRRVNIENGWGEMDADADCDYESMDFSVIGNFRKM